MFRVRFWGVRGSLPVSGKQFQRFGGNTICIEMRCGDDVLLFDAGSGLLPAGQALRAEGVSAFNLFFSHCHYDHIIGLPYFTPLFDPSASVVMWSGHLAGSKTTAQMIGEFMRPPWFPVEPDVCRANLCCQDFKSGDVLTPHPGIEIGTGSLNHPGGAIGYRIEFDGRVVAMITDTEHVPGTLDPAVLRLIRNADLFIYDGTYVDEEMKAKAGYGHSTWQQGIRLARVAGARRLALIHHSPIRTDAELDAIQSAAAAEFPEAFAAFDGQIIEL